MTLPELSIKRPVFATVMNLLIVLLGVICYQRLPLRQYPNIDEPVVNVSTYYAGANAAVIESQITKPIEEALSGIEGVDFIASTSRAEQSDVTLRFRLNRDIDGAASDVRDRVAQARGFLPQDVNEPVVQKQQADAQPIIWLAFSSDRHSDMEIYDIAKRLVKDRLQTVPGVAQVVVYGSQYAMRIWLDPGRLAGFGITPGDIEDALRAQNVEIPAGRVESTNREFTVLAQTDLKTPEEFGAIIVRQAAGYPVRLSDVARVELGSNENRFRARFNGRNAVPLGVVKQSTGNPLDISAGVKALLPQITKTLPEGIRVDVAFDSTVFVEASVKSVYTTIAEAIVLVVIVIFLFLRTGRATIIPLVTIPVSLIGAFALMAAFGFTINILTLLALVLAIGLVVDDAIVMLENIYRHIEEGMEPMAAALQGSREIAFAIVAMTLTLAAVYLPIGFSSGRTGKLFVEFALTLAGAVIVSGFVALTLSPMMCALLLRRQTKHGRFYEGGERVLNSISRGYRRLLDRALHSRKIVVAIAAAMGVGAGVLLWLLPSELAPYEDQGIIIAFGSAPEGSSMDFTDRYQYQIEEALKAVPEMEGYFQIVGFPTVTSAISFAHLVPWSERSRNTQEVQGGLFPQFMNIPGIQAFPIVPQSLGGGGFGQPIDFVVQTTGSYERLQEIVEQLLTKMRANPNLSNADSDLKLNKPELKVDVNRDKVSDVGASVESVGRTLETMLGSRRVTRFKRGSEQYDVLVQVEKTQRTTPEDMNLITVRGNDGGMIPLSNLVTISEGVAPKELSHFNRLRSASISASPVGAYALGDALDFLETSLKEIAKDDAQYDLGGTSREFRESSSSAGFLLMLALAFIFLVLAAQFESFISPFVILLSVPLAVFGALATLKLLNIGAGFGLWTTSGSWNIYSQIGVITLIGLIAKHGILIVEFANQLVEHGKSAMEAAAEAASLRLRPILMTTGAMVLGALPLALASGAGAEARAQIGWVIVGGMSVGTLFTLFVVPVVYTLLAGPRLERAAKLERERTATLTPSPA